MNKKSMYQLAIWGIFFAIFATSCSSKLTPLTSSNFKITPSPLEAVGNEVFVTINGSFPEKWFNPKATVTVTPVLKYTGKEAYGIPYNYQGEKVAGNGITISKKHGGNFNMNVKFPYLPEMLSSALFLRFDAKIKGKKVILPEVKVADGVIATSDLASAQTTTPSFADDGFQRIIKEAHEANILFLIQQSDLRSSELNKNDIAKWKKRVEEAYNDERQTVNVEISAYASPDGRTDLNEKLAEKREANTSQYLEKEMKKQQVKTPINARYTAEDWEGFEKMVQASNLQDKELVLRVLSMYPDPETREREIKNISYVFQELSETILPQLRRSRLTANVEIVGKTDEEIMSFWRNSPKRLSIEELLYASSLTDNNTDKEKMYQYATVHFPQDYRGWNNIGAMYYQNGDFNKAQQAFDRALQVTPNSAEPNMNKSLLALKENKIDLAEELLGKASNAANLEEALGLLYLKNGEYEKATAELVNVRTNNAALAQILVKNYNQASQILKEIKNPDVTTAYLAAIIAARTNNFNEVMTNLQTAILRDRRIMRYALKDLEFAKYRSNSNFMELLR